jgi:hypothetical protein
LKKEGKRGREHHGNFLVRSPKRKQNPGDIE